MSEAGLSLDQPLSLIPGIGPKTIELLNQRGVACVRDLLLYFPRRYDDYSEITLVKNLRPGQYTIKGKFTSIHTRRVRRGLSITEALFSDQSGSIRVIWFNQPYREKSLKKDQDYFLAGEFKLSRNQFSFINPSVELVSDLPLNSARIVPIYPETKGLNSPLLRRVVQQVLFLASDIKEILPLSLIKKLQLMPLSGAIKQLHFPDSANLLAQAKERLYFDELFVLLLGNEITRRELHKQKALKVPFDLKLAKTFVAKLPFSLTDDQRRVIWQIYQDISKSNPMNRLVEGDVGSGKTVVCVMAAVMALAAKYSVAFMAPTELLARQHAETIFQLLKPLGMEDSLILLTGSMSKKQKQLAIDQASALPGAFLIGTHSLLSAGFNLKELALLIIDEQHRFGVDQRQALQKQAGHLPHFLSITATPIPRSLALTILGDLKLSRITTMPDRRQQIKTELVPPAKTKTLYQKLKTQLDAGRQTYVVCPYIRPKDALDHISAEQIFTKYQQQFRGYRVGLIHGQLSQEEQIKVMKEFLRGQIQLLVATTVIEVGVDVANATSMVIYGPEHFGLAQLHQLRGRVGRSEHLSFCYLILSDSLEPLSRLRQFTSIKDGFELSELDLENRGPGAIYGKLQHGKGFSLLNLSNPELVTKAKLGVETFFASKEKLLNYKELAKRVADARQLTTLN